MIAASADVDPTAKVGADTTVWELAQIREHAVVGPESTIGRGAYIGVGVRLGTRVKVQNYALLYEPAVLEDGVFVGPAVILTNDAYPRAVEPDGRPRGADDWDAVGVTVREGASLGARAVCVAPLTIGRWAMIAAGAVVTADVPDFALMVGVPARRVGWVGHAGLRLRRTTGDGWECPRTGELYRESADGVLTTS